MNFPERLETDRLLLRWQTKRDARQMFARYASDPAVTRYLSWKTHQSVQDTLAFMRQKSATKGTARLLNWLIFPRDGGELVGSIGCRVRGPVVEFGYCLARDAWGHGYATEAARAMVATWFEEPAIWRVQAHCDVENRASARVLEKAGLVLEGTLRKYFIAPNLSNVPRDVFCYARVREG